MRNLFSLFVVLIVCSLSCSENPPPPAPEPVPEAPMSYTKPDMTEVLINIWQNGALPAYETSLKKVTSLSEAVDKFLIKPTISNLTHLQSAWISAKLQWERTEVFDIGQINTSFVHSRIDKYVTDARFIDKIISGNEIITPELITKQGSNKVGLPAIEYLIFAKGNNTEVLKRFNKDALAHRYRDLIRAYTKALLSRAEQVNTMANNETDAFITNISNRVTSSLNQIMNAQVALLEEILSLKLLIPLGNKNDGIPQPSQVEAPYAQISFDAITNNLRGIEKMMLADTTKQNIYYLLDYMQRDESEKISDLYRAQLKKAIAAIESLDITLQNAVINDTERVKMMHIEINELIGFIKADISSLLSLTVVFTDVDGD